MVYTWLPFCLIAPTIAASGEPVTHPLRSTTALVLTAALLVPAAAACSEPDQVSTAPVIAPKRPGEEAEVLPPGTALDPVEQPFTAADVAFVAGMIPHHAQALELAALAPERASHTQVLGLASRIWDVQGPEMDVFRTWLTERELAEDGRPLAQRRHDHGGEAGGAGHAGHPADAAHGMASAEDIARLTQARGTEFDRLWLQLMIAHHQGALEMAHRRDLDGGQDVRAGELAADVAVTQLDEIHRMEALLAEHLHG
jgi:uncharacterized protein (DUF305 family)